MFLCVTSGPVLVYFCWNYDRRLNFYDQIIIKFPVFYFIIMSLIVNLISIFNSWLTSVLHVADFPKKTAAQWNYSAAAFRREVMALKWKESHYLNFSVIINVHSMRKFVFNLSCLMVIDRLDLLLTVAILVFTCLCWIITYRRRLRDSNLT